MLELIREGLTHELTYIFSVYGLSFIVMFYALLRILKKSESKTYNDVFWMLACFALSKGLSVLVDAANLIVSDRVELYGITLNNLSAMFAVISNVFVLQFSIDLITCRIANRNIYKVFPVILFSSYIVLFMFGIIDDYDANVTGRYGFGYNGGILASVALFSLYNSEKQNKSIGFLRGLQGLAIGFILYSIFDGVAEKPIMGVPIYLYRMVCAVLIATSSFYLKELFVVKKTSNVGYL